ncbi:MAG TPA: MFS transporter [Terracidiphilus sp.]|nr:MFS transporter [Terracidiphilus sp.]
MASTVQPARPRISPAVATLTLLIALNLLNYIDRYILPGEVSLIQRDFHSTDQQMGALTTALFIFYMIAAPLSGWLGDRLNKKQLFFCGSLFSVLAILALHRSWMLFFSLGILAVVLVIAYIWAQPAAARIPERSSRKALIIFGAILWSLATLVTVWVHDYWTFFIRQALVGIGEATFGIFAPAILADFYPERERNRILSIFYVAIPIGAALGYLAGGQMGSLWGWRAPFFICAIPGLIIAVLYGFWGYEPQRGASDSMKETINTTTFLGLFRNPAFLTATFGLATLTFAMGGISAWVPTFLSRSAGLSVANSSLVVGAITVIDGILGTLVGGWIAQRWLRTNHRALYLLSFWSVALAVPFGILLFFGPPEWVVFWVRVFGFHIPVCPALLAAEFFLFLNTGPLNAAIVNSVSAPVRATAMGVNFFVIHCFGDTFSPQIIGAISDRSNLGIGLGSTLILMVVSCTILWKGARHAPLMEDVEISVL